MSQQEFLSSKDIAEVSRAQTSSGFGAPNHRALSGALSEGQKGLWVLQKMVPENGALNVPLCFRTVRTLNIDAFKQACRFVLAQHPVLADAVAENHGVPYRAPIPQAGPLFVEEDISMLDESAVLDWLKAQAQRAFALSTGPLMRVHLLRRSPTETVVVIVFHHIAWDGNSIPPFLTKLVSAYQQLLQGKCIEDDSGRLSHADFVAWEREMLAGAEAPMHLAYWKEYLSGAPPVLEMPLDGSRVGALGFANEKVRRRLDGMPAEKIRAAARSLGITPAAFFLGIYQLLLSRYARSDDIVVGITVAIRPDPAFANVIGYCTNIIPIRTRIDRTQGLPDFISEVQSSAASSLDHAAYPFPLLVRELRAPRLQGRRPIFQLAFNYQNFGNQLKRIRDAYATAMSAEFLDEVVQGVWYEIELMIIEEEGSFRLDFKYDPELFHASTATRMIDHYLVLMQSIVDDPTRKLSEYSLLSEDERNSVVHLWNATAVDYPKDKCVHELFAHQARKSPNAVAVTFQGKSLSYRELDEKTGLLAGHLRDHGVRPDSLVGICVERSLDQSVGLLAILKAGGAYVPLDPACPAKRLVDMARDMGVSLLMTQRRLLKKFGRLISDNIPVIVIDDDWRQIEVATPDCGETNATARPENLAYVLCTSGGTGNPKSVMVSHRALTNSLVALTDRFPRIGADDRILALSNYCHDIAAFELFGPLIVGGQCIICSSEIVRDAARLKQEIEATRPTIIQATPATWTMLFRAGWQNQQRVKIICGGEVLSERLRTRFVESGAEAWNMFGSTETTIYSTGWRIASGGPITIGCPIANTRVYIVDDALEPVPVGIPGELWIAGDSLAQGYHNQPALTAERFVDSPFKPGERCCRTGDMARWLPDGKIEYLGRVDGQVKPHGYRINLAEIETQLEGHPAVREAVIISHTSQGRSQLIGFYIRQEKGGQRIESRSLRDYLASRLPDYMVPSKFIEVRDIPPTPNGKVDRKGLARLAMSPIESAPDASPEVDAWIERRVAAIWQSVLGRAVDVNEGFFEAGGDSSLAVAISERIKEELDRGFNLKNLFQYSSIKECSRYIAGSISSSARPTVPK